MIRQPRLPENWTKGAPCRIQAASSCWRDSVSSRRAHSQITATRQFDNRRASIVCVSLCLLASSFFRQKSVRVAGMRNSRQFSCACQKQPFTSTTAPHLGSTISGCPSRSFACSRNRKPSRHSIERTCRSGVVFFALILDIRADRWLDCITSTIRPPKAPRTSIDRCR